MFLKRLVLSVVLLASQVFAATYYVSTTGNDSSGNGTSENPWGSIQKFLDSAASGDNCLVEAGTYTGSSPTTLTKNTHQGKLLTITASNGIVYLDNCDISRAFQVTGSTWTSTSQFVFDGICVRTQSGTTSRLIEQNTDGLYEIIFQNAEIKSTDNSTQVFGSTLNNTKAGNFRFRNCVLSAASMNDAPYTGSIFHIGGTAGTLEISDSTINCGSRYGVYVNKGVTNIELNNNIWTTSSSMNTNGYAAIYIEDSGSWNVDRIQINGNIINTTCEGISIQRRARSTQISHNTILVNASSGGCIGIRVGRDGSSSSYSVGRVNCFSNYVEQIGTHKSHCILFGRDIFGGRCEYNIGVNGDYCLVVKSERSVVNGNIAWTTNGTGAIMRSGVGNSFTHNSLYGSVDAIQFDYQTGIGGANVPVENVIINNILAITPSSSGYCIRESSGSYDGNMDTYLVDTNLYLYTQGTGHIAYINGTQYSILSDLQSGWHNYGYNCAYNDTNSIEESAMNITDVGDMATILQSSQYGTSSEMYFSFGAWQNSCNSNQDDPPCVHGDMNGDGQVNFEDIDGFVACLINGGCN